MPSQHDRRRFLQTSLAAGVVLTLSGAEARAANAVSAAGGSARPNPRVRPGQVRWHADFAAARAAAARSGKPVLHFQMLGRLDQKFC